MGREAKIRKDEMTWPWSPHLFSPPREWAHCWASLPPATESPGKMSRKTPRLHSFTSIYDPVFRSLIHALGGKYRHRSLQKQGLSRRPGMRACRFRKARTRWWPVTCAAEPVTGLQAHSKPLAPPQPGTALGCPGSHWLGKAKLLSQLLTF